MLDTYGRKYVNPLINFFSDFFIKLNFTPNFITIIAFLIGISTFLFIYFDLPIIAVVILWISGFLDSVDGAMARKLNKSSSIGTLMDISFDRLVELSIILSLGIKYPKSLLNLLILTMCILMSMTVFLTVGALTKKKGMKSFYYQAGLAERTEGFIMFSLMIIFTNCLNIITNIFALMIFITILQRVNEAKKILK